MECYEQSRRRIDKAPQTPKTIRYRIRQPNYQLLCLGRLASHARVAAKINIYDVDAEDDNTRVRVRVLNSVIYNLWLCCRFGFSLATPRDETMLRRLPSIAYRPLHRIVLNDYHTKKKGTLTELYDGRWIVDDEKGRWAEHTCTVVKPTRKLLRLLADYHPERIRFDNRNDVQMRDDKELPIKNLDVPLGIRSEMAAINEFIRANHHRINACVNVWKKSITTLTYQYSFNIGQGGRGNYITPQVYKSNGITPTIDEMDSMKKHLCAELFWVKRKYINDFEHGGRLYFDGQSVNATCCQQYKAQGIHADECKSLPSKMDWLIDDEPIVEQDIASSHLVLAYHHLDRLADCPEDVYDFLAQFGRNFDYWKCIAKTIITVGLNCKTEMTLFNNVKKKLVEDGHTKPLTEFDTDTGYKVFRIPDEKQVRADAERVKDALFARHDAVRHLFFTDDKMGTTFQKREGDLLVRMMLRANADGQVLLPMHDGWIIKPSYANCAQGHFREAFKELFGMCPKAGWLKVPTRYKSRVAEYALQHYVPKTDKVVADDAIFIGTPLESPEARDAMLQKIQESLKAGGGRVTGNRTMGGLVGNITARMPSGASNFGSGASLDVRLGMR